MTDQKQKITVLVGTPRPSALHRDAAWGSRIEIVDTVYITPQYGTLKDLVSKLNELQRKYGDCYEELRFEEQDNCGCYGDCGCTPTLFLAGTRYETDIEQTYRLAETAKRKVEQAAHDEKQLVTLAARLGKTVV